MRVLRPELYGGEAVAGGTLDQVQRALVHLDFGEACSFFGCPKIHDIFGRGIPADLYLLIGGLLIGVAGGVAGGGGGVHPPRPRGAACGAPRARARGRRGRSRGRRRWPTARRSTSSASGC